MVGVAVMMVEVLWGRGKVVHPGTDGEEEKKGTQPRDTAVEL